ncbi:MAG TPA: GNAT family protein [Bacilli bacterium]|nr:GNAT family protein [Bacilli bacterium]
MVILQRYSLRLRPLQIPNDISLALPWYQDPEVLYYSEGEGTEPYTAETIERMYRWLSREGYVFIIEVLHMSSNDWLPIGDATLRQDMLPLIIGDPSYRSAGLGIQVLHLLIEHAQTLAWPLLTAHKIYSYNVRSQRLFEKAGFVRVGEGTDDHGRLFFQYKLDLPSRHA